MISWMIHKHLHNIKSRMIQGSVEKVVALGDALFEPIEALVVNLTAQIVILYNQFFLSGDKRNPLFN